MMRPACVHIVDHDHHRRARLASQLYDNSIHAEIYECLDELIAHSPSRGVVLISGDCEAEGVEATLCALQSKVGYIPVAYYSEAPTSQDIVRTMSCGALDYLVWPIATDDLLEALKRISDRGERNARVVNRRIEALRQIEGLTEREREILRRVIKGQTSVTIGEELSISHRTAETHRANLMAHLNAHSIADLVRIGIYAGLDDESLLGVAASLH